MAMRKLCATHTSSGGEAPATGQTTDCAGAPDGPGAGPEAVRRRGAGDRTDHRRCRSPRRLVAESPPSSPVCVRVCRVSAVAESSRCRRAVPSPARRRVAGSARILRPATYSSTRRSRCPHPDSFFGTSRQSTAVLRQQQRLTPIFSVCAPSKSLCTLALSDARPLHRTLAEKSDQNVS